MNKTPTLINLTGRPIKVVTCHDKGRAKPSIFRRTYAMTDGMAASVFHPKQECVVDGVSVLRTGAPRVVGLPEHTDPNVFFIVPENVLRLCSGRHDLLAPGNTYKDPTEPDAVLCTHFVGHAD